MSPLAPAGTRGYPDGQRIGNWDTGVLFSDAGESLAAPITTPVLDVSRSAYLAAQDAVAGGDCQVLVRWWADPAGSVLLGERVFMLSQNIAPIGQYRLLNLGPFVSVRWLALTAGAVTHSAQLFGSNRVAPLEFVPVRSVLIDRQNVALANGATVTVYPLDYYAGPVAVWVNPGAGGGLIWAEYLSDAGTWNQISQAGLAAASNTVVIWTMPAGAWRLNLKNTGAASAQTFLTVTPSTTGAI